MILIMNCVHMATLGFLVTSLTQNIWIINAWLTTLRMGVHGCTKNLRTKLTKYKYEYYNVVFRTFSLHLILKHKYSVKCRQGTSPQYQKRYLDLVV